MAFLDQINVNVGTEASPSFVLHDIHDKRFSSTAVTTASHLLATDANLSAFNPITAANLASVLGATQNYSGDLDYLVTPGVYTLMSTQQHTPFGDNSWGVVIVSGSYDLFRSQLAISGAVMAVRGGLNSRADFVGASWSRIDNFGCNTPADLASLLGVIRCSITTDEDYVLNGTPYGYGLLVITNITDGNTSTYNVSAFNVERISNTDCGATVTKGGEYDLIIKRQSGKSTKFVFVPLLA